MPAKKAAYEGFSADERAAMKDHANEIKAASGRKGKGPSREEAEAEVLAKIAEMSAADRAMGERVHAVVTGAAPQLMPRLWYGMPAYAKDGKLICHFQPAQKFKTRYATIGFSDNANLDDGSMWAVAYALPKLTAADEKRIAALVKRAAS
jgi:uncharacterized protein YdhG (YjbR/CyaY superfamily)